MKLKRQFVVPCPLAPGLPVPQRLRQRAFNRHRRSQEHHLIDGNQRGKPVHLRFSFVQEIKCSMQKELMIMSKRHAMFQLRHGHVDLCKLLGPVLEKRDHGSVTTEIFQPLLSVLHEDRSGDCQPGAEAGSNHVAQHFRSPEWRKHCPREDQQTWDQPADKSGGDQSRELANLYDPPPRQKLHMIDPPDAIECQYDKLTPASQMHKCQFG